MKYHWAVASPKPELAAKVAAATGVSALLAQCLVNRACDNPELAAEFLSPRLRSLADPFLIPNMAASVDRLLAAREKAESVVIFGDYDVDGVTATTLLLETLVPLGWKLQSYLPNRLDEGYGLTLDAVKTCVEQFTPSLLLAVDCGSTAVETIAWLNSRGIDVIVLDHHQISSPPPAALALVNPQVAGPGGAGRQLCSAGLAFKLAHAILKRLRALGLEAAAQLDLRQTLDLVALGTVADIVPVTGENRILVRAGLEKIASTQRVGLNALKAAAGVAATVTSYEVGFQLAPRLNAAGRLEDAQEALNLLRSQRPAEAEVLARSLDDRNRRRQEIERAIHDEALESCRARFVPERDYVIVEASESWHLGVVGIVASRIVQRFHRPTLIFGGDGDAWRGSGRSIDGFDLAAALGDCSSLLLRHGGHAMAAGVSIAPANVDPFRDRLNELARARLKPEHLRPTLSLDAETTLAEMTTEQIEELAQIEPCGPANPPVRLVARGVISRQPPWRMGKENQHAKFQLTDQSGGAAIEAVWWNCGETTLPSNRFDLAFTPTINDYLGRRAPVLKILDWRPAS